jgi:hypothetical protein
MLNFYWVNRTGSRKRKGYLNDLYSTFFAFNLFLWWPDEDPVRSKQLSSFANFNKRCIFYIYMATRSLSGFGGLVVSMLASGTQDRGFAPDWSRRIFPAGKIHGMQYDTIQTTIESPISEQWS